MNHSRCLSLLIAACLACGITNAHAVHPLDEDLDLLDLDLVIPMDDLVFFVDIEIALGIFNIDKNFNGISGGSSWQEGYAKYGISGLLGTETGTYYAELNAVSSGTWGDGDPIGLTIGNERLTEFEDMYLGWRFGEGFWETTEDLSGYLLDVSIGRRVITIGDGFIINDDGVNMGNGIDPKLNRGGAYYLAARHAFHKTATLSFNLSENLHGDLIYFKSDNRAQAETGMYAANVEYTYNAIGTLGFTWIHGKELDREFASDFQMQRKGMNVYSLRGTGNAGIDNLFLSFELARQYRDQIVGGTYTGFEDNATAGYAQIGWTFFDIEFTPELTYRYSRYGETWDSLFTGLNRGFGTWFQGEVAANYAGPFNSNTHIHHFGAKITPNYNVSLGLLYFDFSPVKREDPDLSGQELDIYAEWVINKNMMVIPILGVYRPDKDQSNGGMQQSSGTNLYSQLMLVFNFR